MDNVYKVGDLVRVRSREGIYEITYIDIVTDYFGLVNATYRMGYISENKDGIFPLSKQEVINFKIQSMFSSVTHEK